MNELKQRLLDRIGNLRKYKYTILILLIGVALMCIPFDANTAEGEDLNSVSTSAELDLQSRLQEILSKVEGVGEVEVLLSLETGMTHTYQEDTQIRTSDDAQEHYRETVLMSDGGAEEPLETVTTYPTYKGALIVCQGADKATVKLAVIQAVSGVTGLGSDHITVIKMKGK